MSKLETEIISNLATHDKEFMQVFKNFEESDEILTKLESSLLEYKDKLNEATAFAAIKDLTYL